MERQLILALFDWRLKLFNLRLERREQSCPQRYDRLWALLINSDDLFALYHRRFLHPTLLFVCLIVCRPA